MSSLWIISANQLYQCLLGNEFVAFISAVAMKFLKNWQLDLGPSTASEKTWSLELEKEDTTQRKLQIMLEDWMRQV